MVATSIGCITNGASSASRRWPAWALVGELERRLGVRETAGEVRVSALCCETRIHGASRNSQACEPPTPTAVCYSPEKHLLLPRQKSVTSLRSPWKTGGCRPRARLDAH